MIRSRTSLLLALAALTVLPACTAPRAIQLHPIGRYETGVFGESAAEILAYDESTRRLFSVNGARECIDVLDLSAPRSPTLAFRIDVSTHGAPTSVAAHRGLVAVAVAADPVTDPGAVLFFDVHGEPRGSVEVGALPDMLTFTPDGTRVVVAIEGEPRGEVDPRGGVAIIDLSRGPSDATCTNLDFSAYDGEEATLRQRGIRIFPGKRASDDLEPEYVAISADSRTGYVTLQEANAIAVIDLDAPAVKSILGLGYKDHSLAANALDASDADGRIHIAPWPVRGLYMPDSIAVFEADGSRYWITANEGDSRGEDSRVGQLALDRARFPSAGILQLPENLGRLEVSTIDGDVDGDGDYDQLYSYGGRSFSIYTVSGKQVYDSGSDFERITATLGPRGFNASAERNSFDRRSSAKGPEPEALAIGRFWDRTYAIVGLERASVILIYDITDPRVVRFVQSLDPRVLSGDPEAGTAGDLGPEGIMVIPAETSPTGQPLVAVANEMSGTVTIYQVTRERGRGSSALDGSQE